MIELTDSLLADLRAHNLVYVASPYSDYGWGIVGAFKDVCHAAGDLILRGVNIYSPIAHCHAIAEESGLNPLDHSLWMKLDEAMMRACDALLVVKMPGWETSRGVSEEVRFFDLAKKSIYYAGWS